MNAIAIILTPAELQAMVREEVARQIAENLKAAETMPLRMSCAEAARALGVCSSTFHSKYKHLKRYDGNSAYVLRDDLIKLKLKRMKLGAYIDQNGNCFVGQIENIAWLHFDMPPKYKRVLNEQGGEEVGVDDILYATANSHPEVVATFFDSEETKDFFNEYDPETL